MTAAAGTPASRTSTAGTSAAMRTVAAAGDYRYGNRFIHKAVILFRQIERGVFFQRIYSAALLGLIAGIYAGNRANSGKNPDKSGQRQRIKHPAANTACFRIIGVTVIPISIFAWYKRLFIGKIRGGKRTEYLRSLGIFPVRHINQNRIQNIVALTVGKLKRRLAYIPVILIQVERTRRISISSKIISAAPPA